MKFDSVFGYFGINKNYFFHHEVHEEYKEKLTHYPILYFKSVSNFMVKEQMLVVLS